GVAAERFVLDEHEGMHTRGEIGHEPARLEQLGEDDIAHTEAERGQVHAAAADELHEVIVAAAACNGAELAHAIERLEDNTGVIGESANDAVIDADEILEA